MIGVTARSLDGELFAPCMLDRVTAVSNLRKKARRKYTLDVRDGLVSVSIVHGGRVLLDSDDFGAENSVECTVLFSVTTLSEEERNQHLLRLRMRHFSWHAFQALPEVARADRALVLSAVQRRCQAIKFADLALQGSSTVALAAVRQSGRALKYTRTQCRANRKIVLTAVQSYGCALKYASDECRADPEIVLAAVRADSCAFEFAKWWYEPGSWTEEGIEVLTVLGDKEAFGNPSVGDKVSEAQMTLFAKNGCEAWLAPTNKGWVGPCEASIAGHPVRVTHNRHVLYLPETIRGARVITSTTKRGCTVDELHMPRSDPKQKSSIFLVDNTKLKSDSTGVVYRRAKRLKDKSVEIAKFGSKVTGVLAGGWLEVTAVSAALGSEVNAVDGVAWEAVDELQAVCTEPPTTEKCARATVLGCEVDNVDGAGWEAVDVLQVVGSEGPTTGKCTGATVPDAALRPPAEGELDQNEDCLACKGTGRRRRQLKGQSKHRRGGPCVRCDGTGCEKQC